MPASYAMVLDGIGHNGAKQQRHSLTSPFSISRQGSLADAVVGVSQFRSTMYMSVDAI